MRIFPIAILLFIFTAFAAATVNVSSPTSGSTDSSPVHVTSTSSSSHAITRTIIYVDNKSAYSVASGSVNTSLTMASGSHSIVVQSWDSAGTVIKSSSIKITVNSSSGSAPSGSKQYANINQMTGWDSCDACAGAGGSGPKATHTLTQNISSPALDGKAAEFYLKGSKPYSNALWWKQLGANPNVSNFTYDLYFYLKTPVLPKHWSSMSTSRSMERNTFSAQNVTLMTTMSGIFTMLGTTSGWRRVLHARRPYPIAGTI